MMLFNLVTLLAIAGLIGWQAGRFLDGQGQEGRGLGLIGNIAVAVLGAVVLQALCFLFGVGQGWFAGVVQSALGAGLGLALVPLLRRL